MKKLALLCLWLLLPAVNACETRGSGDLAAIIQREAGSVLIVDTSNRHVLYTVDGLGDLSHASMVYSRDERYGYVFGRDGGLSKIDMLCGTLVKRIVQGGNSIGGAISQDGRYIAVSNYEPGGVKIFSAASLEQVADIAATDISGGKRSKTVGLVDAPGNRFVVSLFDSHETWIIDVSDIAKPAVTKITGIGKQPYDALISGNGRYYIAGLFGEDGLALLDLWHPEQGMRRILADYGKGEKKLPVYKMPHLEGWALAEGKAFLPAVGLHQVLTVSLTDWSQGDSIEVHSQPVFAMARPDGRQVWVNFAFPDNDTIQVIDVESQKIIKTYTTGKGVLHMEFSPRGETVWVSVRDADRVEVYDTRTLEKIAELPASKPSGIFMTARAHRIGL